MSTQTRSEQVAAEADQTVASWLTLSRTPGQIHHLKSGGFLVEVGDGGFPVWRCDMGAVRRLLLERDLAAAEVSARS